MIRKKKENQIVVYQNSSGAIELRGDIKNETIWANRMQMAKMFGVNPQAISKHINNIYKEKELNEKATSSKMELVQNESGRIVKRQIDIYNLDILIAVGYRISSITGTKFRQWATKTLREHITKGYTINRKQISKNYDSFMKVVASIENLLPEHVNLDPKAVLELIKEFASTWVSLDSYDRETLEIKGITKKSIKLSADELYSVIASFKEELIKKGETTELFAQERQRGSIEGIIGNVMQSFGGKMLYETAEEKAANLLYFMVKNHPFVDGNKRSGAFAFIWFLRKTKAKGFKNINPATLTALTLFIAESNPKNKEQMIALITQLLM
ncbi:TPA: death-on-curing protein [Candidatus Nomurabacteria bacterium]|uniref:RhuM n=1 Tax=Candidatus Nomurabacteria bacterium GW2011_GWE1_35_16 TaxID=1618761 RepID=A0A0G0EFK1_9BACT|nr:MAG: RhuM [Candidatus Nomurabacteria bacterium GW2011_GWF1_34_20]KKP62745.1 MAG: RhuM [Candidatus Nomurabacteria bacterium GW2011_GWE2_34_25]KKP66117.1 MAG: RhuM [Candidatus Nomurabacteria bacterium GW2011_GWE1_35_16]HAE36343.1 death-on-curing protein [Candidatus Nomurabacteria bacterium]HAX65373.1 death-on-curing protein [Candidatus Nomurabacteria bacterium]